VLYGKLRPYLNKVLVPEFDGKCSTEIVPLRPTDRLVRRYLAYFLRSATAVARISERTAGARMPRADMDFVLNLEIPLPLLAEQRRIVDLLSRAEGIVRLRREALAKAQAVIPALFLDMFGDPATNPRGWPVEPLGALADVQGGLQVTRARASLPIERPYLRVANVYRGSLDLAEIKTLRLTEAEWQRAALERGDLLVVEGHGNPQEVGRIAVWDGSIAECTHQNHLIRARPDRSRLFPTYACALLNSEGGRRVLVRSGKTTSGLSTISTKNVKEVPTMLPPLTRQALFKEHVESIEFIAQQQTTATLSSEQVFQALLARTFGGRG